MRIGVGEHVHLAAARAHFLDVRFQLFEQNIVGRNRDHRHLIGNQRERAVLQFTRRIGFCVDIRDFFQLKRTFERDRKMPAASQEQRVLLVRELASPRNDLRFQRKHGLQRSRQMA